MKNKGYKVYSVNSKSKGGFWGVTIVICGLLLTISVCNLLGYAFFSSGLSIVSGKERNGNSFYAVELDSFDSYNEANKFATNIQQKGGAGYITYNKEYKVLSSLYVTYNDAKAVADNVKQDYPDATVYEIVFVDVKLPDDLTSEQHNAITTSLEVIKSAISTMTNIYLGIDTGELSNETAHSMLQTLYDDSVTQAESISSAFHSKDEAIYLKYKMYLTDFASNISQICSIDMQGMELSQIIKYQQLKSTFLYLRMRELFNGD